MNVVQFADFVDEQNAAVCFGDGARFGLGYTRYAHGACSLVNGIMNGADKRIGDTPFVKTGRAGIHLDKLGISAKGRYGTAFGLFQNQPGGCRFSDTRRTVNQHMLGIRAAQGRLEGFQPFLLADDFGESGRSRFFRQRFRQRDFPQALQLVHFFF